MTIAKRICGSMNQTTQMHQISRHLTAYGQAFTPYYCDGTHEVVRRVKPLEFATVGDTLAKPCHQYMVAQNLAIDYQGRRCQVLITRYPSTVFVGLALGKGTYSDFPMDEPRRLLPVQNNSAALNIATVCRHVIEDQGLQ